MKKENLIIVVDSNMEINEYDLNSFRKTQIKFGHSASNQIVFASEAAAPEHGAFEFSDGNLYIYDRGSANGIVINNRVYKTDSNGNADVHRLHDGDIIRIDGLNNSSGVMMLYRTRKTPGVWQKTNVSQQGSVLIGRSSQCNLRLDSINVSRRHAIIRYINGGYIIEDLNSSNGVFVNGTRVNGRAPIREKDIIGIANTTLFFINGILMYKSNTDGTRVVMRNISRTVTVKGQKRYILKNVNLTVEPNEFIAVIGGSGAGKSTVMNAMSGFEQATEGSVYVNNTDLYQNYQILKNMIGYVPQQDIIYENMTLQKMLEFSAKMRMPEDVSSAERSRRIAEVLSMVELTEHKDKYIRSLSGGQKKRASIAVELLADPGLFFLDEPTSGLDPGTEESLMKTLNRLSKQKGKTIVMVTHTTQNLHLCDKILFMGAGGVVCFYGSPSECMDFFGVENLTEIYNKLLTPQAVEYWSQKFKRQYSSGGQQNGGASRIQRQKKASFFRQFGILSARYMTLIKNDLQRLLMIFAQPIIIAVLLALVAADDVFEIYNSTQSIMFAASCAGIWVGLFNSIQEICKERNILKREYMANLRLGAYVLSKFVVQFIMSVVQALIMTGFFTAVIGSPEKGVTDGGAFLEMLITMTLTIFSSASIGLVVSSVSKNSDKAMTTAPFLLIIQLLFSGILFKLKDMTEKISYITVSRWSVAALGTMSDLNSLEMAIKGMPHEAEDIYEYTVSNIFTSWSVLAGFVVVCFVLCVVLLRNVSKDSR